MSAPPLQTAGGTGAGAPSGSAGDIPDRSPTGGERDTRRGDRRPGLVVIVVLAVLAAVLAGVARGYYRDGLLEHDAPTPQGSRAVVTVLGDLDVDVDVARRTSDAADALRSGRTVLVTSTSGLGAEQLDLLSQALAENEGEGRLVLVRPDAVALSVLAPDVSPAGALEESAVLPAEDCGDLSFGARAVRVLGEDGAAGASRLYRAGGEATGCFADDDPSGSGQAGALVVRDGDVVVLGSADLLTNEGIGESDNSALALNLLGDDGAATWYLPSAADPLAASSATLLTHLPRWAAPVALWLLVVALIALVAVGRRTGPVVVEPLPVSVRPQELVLGRSRLLHRADARDAAAAALRAAACSRLAARLGLHRESSLDALIAALVEQSAPESTPGSTPDRTPPRTPQELRDLLGPSPVTTDQDLVALAEQLDRLEKEIDR